MPAYLDPKRTRMTKNQLHTMGYTGKNIKDAVKKAKKDYPQARVVK